VRCSVCCAAEFRAWRSGDSCRSVLARLARLAVHAALSA
jgi:hypothetical protein